jgi:hypothetical protein
MTRLKRHKIQSITTLIWKILVLDTIEHRVDVDIFA